MVLRVLSGAFGALFLVSAALQYNDPDPAVWMGLYGIAAVVSVMGAAGRYSAWSVVAVIALAGYALYLAPKGIGPWLDVADNPDTYAGDWEPVERAREAGGLLICAIWLTVLAVVWFRKQHETAEPQPEKRE